MSDIIKNLWINDAAELKKIDKFVNGESIFQSEGTFQSVVAARSDAVSKVQAVPDQPQMGVDESAPTPPKPNNFFQKMDMHFLDLKASSQSLGILKVDSVKRTVTGSSLDHKAEENLVYYPRNTIEGDYDDQTINMGAVEYTNVKDLLARFFLSAHYHNQRIPNWRDYCVGITSRIGMLRSEDDTGQECRHYEAHMPLFDYDGKNIKTLIRKDVKMLQKDFGLGPAHVFRTKRGFHVIFMCDAEPLEEYREMLNLTKCCKGFKKVALRNAFGTLRVSAKYTEFDIEPEYVLDPKEKKLWRKLRKAHLIETLHSLGKECGTHFADMFPDWANFQEDEKPWKGTVSRGTGKGKRLKKKVPAKDKLVMKKATTKYGKATYTPVSGPAWTTTSTKIW